MNYTIINDLPIDLNFSNKSKKELQLYGEWFCNHKQQRLDEIIGVIKNTAGFEFWIADFTPQSLIQLCEWLIIQVKTEKLSDIEYKNKRATVPYWIEINDYDLTTEAYSKLVDVGIYFGEVFIHNYRELKWEQYFSKIKNDNNNGHIVIKGFGKLELNPIWVVYIVGSKIAGGNTDKNLLYNLYNTWCNYLSKT
jgi:hypothetical protein